MLAAVDLAAKALADTRLADTSIDLHLIELRRAYNSGVAFGLGDTLPAWSVVMVTGAIIVAMAGYAWHAIPSANRWQRGAGAAIVAGALANLIDRIPDGTVTDYLHTGWWPTFNLADILITIAP